MSLINKIKNKKFIRFIFVGCSAFAVDFLSLNILFYIFNIQNTLPLKILDQNFDIYIANMIAIILSLIANFSLNKIVTFHSPRRYRSEIIKFGMVIALNYVLNNIIFTILFTTTNNLQFSKIIATGSQIIWTFFLYKYFVFRFNKDVDKELLVINNDRLQTHS